VIQRPSLALLAGGVLLIVAGCAPQLDRIETRIDQSNEEMARLRGDQQQMRQDLAALTNLLRVDQNVGMESDAQRVARLSQLSRQLEQLMQKLDDNTEFMRSLSARVDLLATRAGIPTLGEFKRTAGTPPAQDPLPEEGRAVFQAAQLDRNRGNDGLARDGFREFLAKYPRSELADDALYWLGDLAYGEGDNAQALQYFEQLQQSYPGSDKLPAGLLKAAYCLEALGRKAESRQKLELLIDAYPDSPEAALARERIAGP
jgi:tol-pal system protein YbgF